MTNLKTIDSFYDHTCDVDDCCRGDALEELKQAAINWVKHLRSCNRDLQLPKDTIEVNWIIQFFNLTKDDLK